MSSMPSNKEKPKKLYRSKTNSVIAGVAGGLGKFLDTDPIVFRLLFLASLLFGGVGIVVYLVMWLIIPADSTKGIIIDEESLHQGAEEMKQKASKLKEDVDEFVSTSGSKKVFGVVILILGSVLLLSNLGIIRVFDIFRFWPLLLILLGIILISKRD